jgi:NAD(P)H dehydrogenase (quinone)
MTKIVVTGATGHLGGATVNHLLDLVPASDITVVVRNAEKASSLAARGVSVAIGDYFDKDSLVSAFRGADNVLLIGSPAHSGDRLLQQTNMVEAVKEARAGHAVYVGLQRKEGSQAKISAVTDVEIAAEATLKASGVPYTIVRNTVYTNHLRLRNIGPNFLKVGMMSFGPETKTTYVEIDDLGLGNAKLLLQSGHENKIYNFNAGEALSFREIAALCSEIYGKEIPFKTVSILEFLSALLAAGVPQPLALYAADFTNATAAGDFSEASTALADISGRKPMTLKESIEKDPTPVMPPMPPVRQPA